MSQIAETTSHDSTNTRTMRVRRKIQTHGARSSARGGRASADAVPDHHVTICRFRRAATPIPFDIMMLLDTGAAAALSLPPTSKRSWGHDPEPQNYASSSR